MVRRNGWNAFYPAWSGRSIAREPIWRPAFDQLRRRPRPEDLRLPVKRCELFHDCASFEQRVQCAIETLNRIAGAERASSAALPLFPVRNPPTHSLKQVSIKLICSRSDGIHKENQKSENTNIS